MTVSPFDHPLLAGLFGDGEVAAWFSVAAELDAMLDFERALAAAEAELGVIPPAAGATIAAALDAFTPHIAELRTATGRDGVVVPELVRQIRNAVGEPHARHVHFGATSQDAIDTALILRLKSVLAIFEARLDAIIAGFVVFEGRFGSGQVTAVTRMQPAIQISVGSRIETWRQPLERHKLRLREQCPRLLVVQFGGPVGTLDALGEAGRAVRASLAARLGLADAPQWHNQRDTIAELSSWLSLVTASLGKFGQDVALMALDGSAIRLSGGGGSSAMPHKQNPVKAEALETLARFNATQTGAMHQAAIHPLERSGAAWSLEWLILPQMVVATGAALRLAEDLIGDIKAMGK
jgi:3-carboxy-cis,cis-muconate cycloisomerase